MPDSPVDAPNPDAMTSTAEAILAAAAELDGPEIPAWVGGGPAHGMCELKPRDYHADPCAVPSLSSSVANVLLAKSPAHAYTYHPRLGGLRRESTKAQDAGTLLHALLLGGERIHSLPYRHFRTKKAKDHKADVLRAGGIPVLRHKLKPVEEAADAIREKLLAKGIAIGEKPARQELSAFWSSPSTVPELGAVQCRATFDELLLTDGAGVVRDLKMTRNASPEKLDRTVEDYGYAVQRAAYVEAVETLEPDLIGCVDYQWIFVEQDPPYAISIAEADGELVALGEWRWRYAVDTWARCLASGKWPGYIDTPARVGVVPWARDRELAL